MAKWKRIGSDEFSLDKKEDSDIKHHRVTEILSAHPKDGCEKSAYMSKRGNKQQLHVYTVAGSVVHWMIDTYLAENYDMTMPPSLKNELTDDQWELYDKERKKENYRAKDGRLIKAQRIQPRIENAYENFLRFMNQPVSIWNRHTIQPLYIERTVWHDFGEDEDYKELFDENVVGTIDFIGIANFNGIEEIVILDWKSGRTEVPSHAYQLAAYRYMLEKMRDRGDIILPDLPISNKVWCVKFGGMSYEATMYNANRKSFLEQFFRAAKIYKTVTNNPRGWCIRCMFCSFRHKCNS